MYNNKLDAKYFNEISKGHFPDLLGIEIIHVEEGKMNAECLLRNVYEITL